MRLPGELRALRELFLAGDPAPSRVVDAAYGAVARAREWSSDSAALELVCDSADGPVSAPVRAGRRVPESRSLSFAMPGRVVEVDFVPTVPGTLRATGMVISRTGRPPTGELVVRHGDGHSVGELDGHGAFRVDDIPSGPVSPVLRTGGVVAAVADWLVC